MQNGTIRIIGGQWRSRPLQFPTHLAVKPTPNRIRETLFNWLQTQIEGAICLDLFAGSGALGFEALSRGANWVSFVENSRSVAQSLQKQLNTFQAHDRGYVHTCSYDQVHAYHFTQAIPNNQQIDIVFLDPPFHQGLIERSLQWLETQKSILSTNTLLYIEYETDLVLPDNLKQHWVPLRQKKAGKVHYELWERC